MSYIALRQLIQDSAETQKFLNDQMKAFQHALFYGISTLPVPEKFEGLADRLIPGLISQKNAWFKLEKKDE